ncbi:hypothetical protein PCS_03183 [Desulfocurvibacter africanus PCS]|uniref:Uncharacterized protein n=2 Tax=Desulfocurvibacter africanus TaxID=873 RepID=F3Z169_DESAF|nr:hypothetical protein [Desulfocurvibacter africanus]EGJ49967.1 hypothetical protein Desaf_1631 [Desulfocurvibacter africanus subsp. africanus str. Walvis Bay]EMG35984.1 hypothetical protein PCS_03183 [Desulfocurvibacter africanus PCS]
MRDSSNASVRQVQSINWAAIRREVELAKNRLNYAETFSQRNSPRPPVSEELRGTILASRT